MTTSACVRCGEEVDPGFEFCPSCCDDHAFLWISEADAFVCESCGTLAPDDFNSEQPGDDLP
jgi:NMD protein affecting ribosome stability and mRNA decay